MYSYRVNKRDIVGSTGLSMKQITKLANNTFQYHLDGATRIRLHRTEVIVVYPDGSFRLNSGGWQTVTTKDRMNSYMPAGYISQHNYEWTVHLGDESCPYFDGMLIRITEDGYKLPDDSDNPRVVHDHHTRLMASQIDNIVQQVKDLPVIPSPNQVTDCEDCFNMVYDGVTRRVKSKKYDHVRQHILDGHVDGSLIACALLWAGYNPDAVRSGFLIQESAVRAVRRYLRACAGFAH